MFLRDATQTRRLRSRRGVTLPPRGKSVISPLRGKTEIVCHIPPPVSSGNSKKRKIRKTEVNSNGLAGVQSDLAPCAAETQLLCNTAPSAVHGGILPQSHLLFAALHINIRRHIPHTWRQIIGLHQRSEVLAPYANNACTGESKDMHQCCWLVEPPRSAS